MKHDKNTNISENTLQIKPDYSKINSNAPLKENSNLLNNSIKEKKTTDLVFNPEFLSQKDDFNQFNTIDLQINTNDISSHEKKKINPEMKKYTNLEFNPNFLNQPDHFNKLESQFSGLINEEIKNLEEIMQLEEMINQKKKKNNGFFSSLSHYWNLKLIKKEKKKIKKKLIKPLITNSILEIETELNKIKTIEQKYNNSKLYQSNNEKMPINQNYHNNNGSNQSSLMYSAITTTIIPTPKKKTS